jgi:hypothetical protein
LSANYPLVPEDLEFGQGIDSMSLNPDSVGDTWLSTGELLMRGMAIGMQYVLRTLPPGQEWMSSP